MATGYKICKVCGEVYECCLTNRPGTIFRWQDVACSPEHGAIYFRAIAESRGEIVSEDTAVVEEPDEDEDEDDWEEEDDWLEDDSDDEEEIEIER